MPTPIVEIPGHLPVSPLTSSHSEPQSDSLTESKTVQLAGSLSSLEIEIVAAFWNHHPQPLRLSQIYLAVRAGSDDPLQPFVEALARLVDSDLVHHTGEPLFHYLLNKKGTFLALYLAIAGVNEKFSVAVVEEKPKGSHKPSFTALNSSRVSPQSEPIAIPSNSHAPLGLPANAWDNLRPSIVKPACEVEIENCSFDCGRVATGHCECGNAVCSTHRYNVRGRHDPSGVCSTCYDEMLAEHIGVQQYGEA